MFFVLFAEFHPSEEQQKIMDAHTKVDWTDISKKEWNSVFQFPLLLLKCVELGLGCRTSC
jgi:hypothetical protein